MRDYTDVRDAINALMILAERGVHGDVYNICTGNHYKVDNLLEKLISFSTVRPKIKKDPMKERILEDPIFVGDNTKLRKLGWEPEIPIEKTLKDIIDYWREQI